MSHLTQVSGLKSLIHSIASQTHWSLTLHRWVDWNQDSEAFLSKNVGLTLHRWVDWNNGVSPRGEGIVRVSPYTGEWIEIHDLLMDYLLGKRLTLHRWVDWNIFRLKSSKLTMVSHYTGEWIEMIMNPIKIKLIRSHLTQVSGLKSGPVPPPFQIWCLTLHRWVDWNQKWLRIELVGLSLTLHRWVDWNRNLSRQHSD